MGALCFLNNVSPIEDIFTDPWIYFAARDQNRHEP
jgi:hypothetical protein